jgi:hypothetical protein
MYIKERDGERERKRENIIALVGLSEGTTMKLERKKNDSE